MRSSYHREILVVGVLTTVGTIARLWALGRIELSQFDEGVYALVGLWSMSPRGVYSIDPAIISYAPPGLIVLIGCAYSTFGLADLSALFVSLTCGVLTIPVVAWIGRRTFGEGAGAASAALAALSLAHIAFSRKVLCDVPFLLAWSVALAFGIRFLERPGFARACALGGAVGLAQNLKYNGWLAGGVVALSALIGLVARKEDRGFGVIARTFGWGALAAVIAGLAYAPWFLFVERHGGYSALMQHHRGYLGGFDGWRANWVQQMGQLETLSGGHGWATLGWVMAWIAYGVVAGLFPKEGKRLTLLGAAACSPLWIRLALTSPVSSLPWWLGLLSAPWLMTSSNPALRIQGTAWALMSVLTPFYHPYARLWLPLHMSGWVLVGGVVARSGLTLITRGGSGVSAPSRRLTAFCLIGAVIAVAQVALLGAHGFPASWVLRPSPSFRRLVYHDLPAVPQIEEASRHRNGAIKLLARRPLAFYLLIQGRYRFQVQTAQGRIPEPAGHDQLLMIDEAVVGLNPRPFMSPRGSWVEVASFPETLDPVTLLDVAPDVIYERIPMREYRTRLFSENTSPSTGTAPAAAP